KFAEFYNITSEGLVIWVILVTSKRSSGKQYMKMSAEILYEIERLDEFVTNTSTTFDGERIHFKDVKSTEINDVFHWYKYAYSLSEYLSDIHLNFPVSETMGHKFFIGNHFFGVNLDKGSQSGPIESMEYVTLWYMNQVENISQRRKLQAIQMELFERSRLDNFSDLISFGIYGDQIASKEMLRGTQGTVKFFILGVVLMVVFMSFTFNHIAFGSKILIIGAIGVPATAVATCFAILGWIKFPFNSIMCITPFLVMGIGVDDAFLLLHSWRRHGHLDTKERMRAAVHEIGPSMAITSATNTLAFGIGIASSTPLYTPINFISLMPDLSNSHDVTVFFEMIHRLENSEGCYGPERTQLMLRNFIE
ncbi:hypothetical protein Angca_003994, partial [Angiostrongylus cantonensis]